MDGFINDTQTREKPWQDTWMTPDMTDEEELKGKAFRKLSRGKNLQDLRTYRSMEFCVCSSLACRVEVPSWLGSSWWEESRLLWSIVACVTGNACFDIFLVIKLLIDFLEWKAKPQREEQVVWDLDFSNFRRSRHVERGRPPSRLPFKQCVQQRVFQEQNSCSIYEVKPVRVSSCQRLWSDVRRGQVYFMNHDINTHYGCLCSRLYYFWWRDNQRCRENVGYLCHET